MGKGVLVMLMGTAGVMVGAVVAYMLVHTWLSDDAWKGYGALAGSWIGGTANMAATAEMLGTSEEQFGLAVIADNVIYVVWLPLLLMSRDFADRFNKWARVPAERLEAMDAAAAPVSLIGVLASTAGGSLMMTLAPPNEIRTHRRHQFKRTAGPHLVPEP